MLRAFTTESGALDVGTLYLQRTQALEAKKTQLASDKVPDFVAFCPVHILAAWKNWRKNIRYTAVFTSETKKMTVACSVQETAIGTSYLAQRLVGRWTAAPKRAREDYEHFIGMVSSLLGGEASSEELEVCPRTCPRTLHNGCMCTVLVM
jgi:hypothetical protein